jgi:hypothetical protein
MKRIPAFSVAMMLVASVAFAQGRGLHMKWAGCPNHPAATTTENFLCDGAIHSLHGTFSLTTAVPGVVAMDGIIDLLFETPFVPTFWQFQAGACNESGIQLFAGRPTVNCTSTANTTTLCSTSGSGCGAYITAYAHGGVIGFPPNRARLLFALARAGNVVTLGANTGTNAHFAFRLELAEDNAVELGGRCGGCGTGVSITWNQAVLYNTSATAGSEGIAATISSGDPGSIDATAYTNCSGCQTVSAKPTRWGQLKAMYR